MSPRRPEVWPASKAPVSLNLVLVSSRGQGWHRFALQAANDVSHASRGFAWLKHHEASTACSMSLLDFKQLVLAHLRIPYDK